MAAKDTRYGLVGTLGALGLSVLASERGRRVAEDIYDRWNLDSDDENARVIVEETRDLWRTWNPSQRELLLVAAERIAVAEAAKTARVIPRPKAMRFDRIAHGCLECAETATTLLAAHPPPWSDEQRLISALIRDLAEFAVSCLTETLRSDYNAAISLAEHFVRELRLRTPRRAGRASAELIAKLAWLAGGQRSLPIDESTVRRYETVRRKAIKPPGAAVFRRAFVCAREVATTLSAAGTPVSGNVYRQAIRAYLDGKS